MKTFAHQSLIKYLLDREASISVLQGFGQPPAFTGYGPEKTNYEQIINLIEANHEAEILVYPKGCGARDWRKAEWALIIQHSEPSETVSDHTIGGLIDDWAKSQ